MAALRAGPQKEGKRSTPPTFRTFAFENRWLEICRPFIRSVKVRTIR